MLFSNLCKPFTISPDMRLADPPRTIILLLIEIAPCQYLSWLKRGLIWQVWFDKMIGVYCSPQCCVVSPIIFAFSPRDASSPTAAAQTSANDQLLTVFHNREGVEPSPLGGEWKDEKDERLPGAGNGGMVQVGADDLENVSMLVLAPKPPVMISPVMGNCMK